MLSSNVQDCNESEVNDLTVWEENNGDFHFIVSQLRHLYSIYIMSGFVVRHILIID